MGKQAYESILPKQKAQSNAILNFQSLPIRMLVKYAPWYVSSTSIYNVFLHFYPLVFMNSWSMPDFGG